MGVTILSVGYYALHEANAKGCLQCFCYGITGECRAAELGVEVTLANLPSLPSSIRAVKLNRHFQVIEHAEGWVSTDLRGRIRVEPYWSTMTSGVTVAEEDMQGVHAYFWEAPQQARYQCRICHSHSITVLEEST